MKRKMLRVVVILSLGVTLSLSMSGCAEKGDGETGLADIQSAIVHDGDEIGNSSREGDDSEVRNNSEACC